MANSPLKLPQLSPWLWAALTIVGGVVAAQIYGRGAFFLVAGGAVLLGAVAILWNSLLSLTGDAQLTLDEALSLAAPSAEEERKESVLRALKDLEYERNVGKLSEDDYRELSRRYRQDAKQLLQLVDENLAPARARAIAELEERLEALAPAKPEADAEMRPDAAQAAAAPEAAPELEAAAPEAAVEPVTGAGAGAPEAEKKA